MRFNLQTIDAIAELAFMLHAPLVDITSDSRQLKSSFLF